MATFEHARTVICRLDGRFDWTNSSWEERVMFWRSIGNVGSGGREATATCPWVRGIYTWKDCRGTGVVRAYLAIICLSKPPENHMWLVWSGFDSDT
jgi:hypothetical protein